MFMFLPEVGDIIGSLVTNTKGDDYHGSKKNSPMHNSFHSFTAQG